MIILCIIVTIYYNVIMAYSVVYLGASIVGTWEELPWTYCGKIKHQSCSYVSSGLSYRLRISRAKVQIAIESNLLLLVFYA